MNRPGDKTAWRALGPLFLAIAVLAIALNVYQFLAGREPGDTVPAAGDRARAAAPQPTAPASASVLRAEDEARGETPAGLTAAGDESAAAAPFEMAPLDRLRAAFADTDPITRTEKFLQAARLLSVDEYAAALALIEEIPRESRFGSELRLMVDLWVRADPKGALDYFSSVEEGGESGRENSWKTSEAIRLWVERDPRAAVQWAQDNGADAGGDDGNPYLASAIRALAKSDVAWAGQLAQTLPYGRLRGDAMQSVLKSHLDHGGPERAFEYVSGIADEKLKEGAYYITIGEILDDDPQAALRWVAETPSEELRSKAMPRVISEWAEDDPNAAGEWLNAQPPSPEMDRTVRAFTDRISREDPEAAWAWASTITSEGLRFDTYRNVYGQWSKRDPETARRRFLESDLPAEWKAKLGGQK